MWTVACKLIVLRLQQVLNFCLRRTANLNHSRCVSADIVAGVASTTWGSKHIEGLFDGHLGTNVNDDQCFVNIEAPSREILYLDGVYAISQVRLLNVHYASYGGYPLYQTANLTYCPECRICDRLTLVYQLHLRQKSGT